MAKRDGRERNPSAKGDDREDPRLDNGITSEDNMTVVLVGIMEVTNSKKCVVNLLEQMVSKRTRLSSQYIICPYTIKAKKITLVDCMLPNLFSEVDPMNKKVLHCWFKRDPSKYFMKFYLSKFTHLCVSNIFPFILSK